MIPGPLSVTVMRNLLAWLGATGSPVRDHFQLDGDIRQNAGLLTGIQGVIHGFFDAGEQRLARVVEAEQMPVLGEEFGNGNFPLPRTHFHRGDLLLRRVSFGRLVPGLLDGRRTQERTSASSTFNLVMM